MSAAPKMAPGRTRGAAAPKNEDVAHASWQWAIWVVISVALTCLYLASRKGQTSGFVPWDDFLANLFQQ
jgi:hypothetical protein